MEACNDSNADVRQAAIYGIGVCAEFGGSKFKTLVGEALSGLNFVISQPNARESDNVMSTDNAISALGKICQFHRDSIDAPHVVPAWLSCLPIKEVLCASEDLATEHTIARMVNLLRQLQQMISPSALASTWSSLQPQQQMAL